MTASFGISWNDGKNRAVAAAVALFLASGLLMMTPTQTRALSDSTAALVRVLVQRSPGAGDAPERAVRDAGGRVVAPVEFVHGIVAEVPESSIAKIEAAPGVQSVARDRRMHAESDDQADATAPTGTKVKDVDDIIGASSLAVRGDTGKGIDVAVIDSGIAPVPALAAPGKVVNGVDLSPDAAVAGQKFLDGFGHGTHMAGIIAGRDDSTGFVGVAPDARVLNVKAADHAGNTSTIQLLMSIGWVIAHRYDNGMNVRVINLSFGADGSAGYLNDPLAVAVEAAWKAGIVVVVSGGNTGLVTPTMTSPAIDPYVISVGAVDTNGTITPADDTIPAWSSPGDASRHPDLVAPGRSILSLQVPGGFLDSANPQAEAGNGLFKGSGTSQAAAVVSGSVALLLQQRPYLTPDQVKRILTSSATKLPAADATAQGKGMVNLAGATVLPAPSAWTARQSFPAASFNWATMVDKTATTGTVSADGNSWSGNSWSGNSWSGNSWSGNSWSGNSWSGNSWSGNSWSGNSWSGNSWSAESYS